MAMSAPLAVLMAKVLVMISVIAAIMAFATIFGLSIPKRLDKMDMAGGRQQRFSSCLRGCFKKMPSAEYLPVITLLATVVIALGGRKLGFWKFDLVENPNGWVRDL